MKIWRVPQLTSINTNYVIGFMQMFSKPSIKFQYNGLYVIYLMLRWLERILILSLWICCRNRSVSVRTRAGGSRFLSCRSHSHACTAGTFRRQESAGRDRLGEKREIRVNVRNSGFAIREFKHVFYNSKLSRTMLIKARVA